MHLHYCPPTLESDQGKLMVLAKEVETGLQRAKRESSGEEKVW